VEDQESLETSTLVSQFSETVQNQVDQFLSDSVVTTCVVVGSVFLAGDQLFGVEQLSVSSGTDLIDDSGFQIDKDSSRHVFAGSGLTEEGVEGVISTSDGLVTGHLAVRLDSMLQTVQFPASVSDLDTGLTDMN
jgi:predicted TIM-barrel enzyme